MPKITLKIDREQWDALKKMRDDSVQAALQTEARRLQDEMAVRYVSVVGAAYLDQQLGLGIPKGMDIEKGRFISAIHEDGPVYVDESAHWARVSDRVFSSPRLLNQTWAELLSRRRMLAVFARQLAEIE